MSEKRTEPEGKVPEFQLVDDSEEARKLLKEGFRALAPAMVWTTGQKHVLNTQLSVFHEKDGFFYVAVPTEVDPAWFAEQLEGLGSDDCFFSVSLARANIFFKARLIDYDDAGFKFNAPKAVYKVQRRKNVRLFIPFGRVIRVEMPDPTFPDQKLSKKIFDISSGGLSFVATESEAPLFPAGVAIKNLFFSIGSRKITADGEVRHVREQASDSAQPGFKVGILFTRIGEGDAQWIAAFVFEESRKLMPQFM